MTYTIVNVTPDTDEWMQERLNSIGASEVPAVLGLSTYQTPLGVYRAKKGIESDFDPERAYVGHASEVLIEGYLRKFRAELGSVGPAVMVRSVEYPWLHASLDRVLLTADGEIPIQMKSAHFFGVRDWEEGTPLVVNAQIQSELLCFDKPYGYAAVFGGDMRVRIYRVERDEEFIQDYIIPSTREFWDKVQSNIEPEPTTLGEVAEVWPSTPGKEIEASDAVLEAAERRAVLLSDARAQEAEAKALTLAIAQYMQDAEALVGPDGPVLTFKTQAGKRGVTDLDLLEATHPEFVKRGDPFKVMRHARRKATT